MLLRGGEEDAWHGASTPGSSRSSRRAAMAPHTGSVGPTGAAGPTEVRAPPPAAAGPALPECPGAASGAALLPLTTPVSTPAPSVCSATDGAAPPAGHEADGPGEGAATPDLDGQLAALESLLGRLTARAAGGPDPARPAALPVVAAALVAESVGPAAARAMASLGAGIDAVVLGAVDPDFRSGGGAADRPARQRGDRRAAGAGRRRCRLRALPRQRRAPLTVRTGPARRATRPLTFGRRRRPTALRMRRPRAPSLRCRHGGLPASTAWAAGQLDDAGAAADEAAWASAGARRLLPLLSALSRKPAATALQAAADAAARDCDAAADQVEWLREQLEQPGGTRRRCSKCGRPAAVLTAPCRFRHWTLPEPCSDH